MSLHVDIKSALVGALIGGVITSVVGPIAVEEFTRNRSTSHWEGTWHTIICAENSPTGFEYEMRLSQIGDRVAGPYRGSNDASAPYHGHIVGEAGVESLTGNWQSFRVRDSGGEITFVLSEDGHRFHGRYDDRGSQRQWVGSRANNHVSCEP